MVGTKFKSRARRRAPPLRQLWFERHSSALKWRIYLTLQFLTADLSEPWCFKILASELASLVYKWPEKADLEDSAFFQSFQTFHLLSSSSCHYSLMSTTPPSVSINYASLLGIQSLAAAVVFTILFAPFALLFLWRTISRFNSVHVFLTIFCLGAFVNQSSLHISSCW